MGKYLDETGLAYFWGKVKDYIDSHSGGGGSSEIATITDVPITINTISGVTVDNLSVTQCGHIVEVTLYLTLTAALSSNTTLATGLPEPHNGTIRMQSNLFGTSYERPLRVLVSADGTLTIRYGSANVYYLTATYIADDTSAYTVNADTTAY